MLLDHDVAAIVLDIRMPGVTGFELAKIIKGTKKACQIPIVFLTAHMMEDHRRDRRVRGRCGRLPDEAGQPSILRHKIAVFADLFRKTRALAELNETLEARVSERTAELERSEAALRAAARQKDEFLATLAHELRNPLAPLRLGLDLLLHAQPPFEELDRTLSVMNRQLDHMVRLIDDLLDVARISGGMLELKKERTDLATIVRDRDRGVQAILRATQAAGIDACGDILDQSCRSHPPRPDRRKPSPQCVEVHARGRGGEGRAHARQGARFRPRHRFPALAFLPNSCHAYSTCSHESSDRRPTRMGDWASALPFRDGSPRCMMVS